jgi:selenide,water dikinase
MVTLNRAAAEALCSLPGSVHGCTDITGFGLIGHASEMAAASQVTIVIEADAVPLLPGARDLVATNRADGMKTNQSYFPVSLRAGEVEADVLSLLYDPQTSGGLLASVAAQRAEEVAHAFAARGVPAVRIGRVEAPSDARVGLA